MNLFTPAEMVDNYAAVSIKKSQMKLGRMFILAILAGMFIAFAADVTNTASMGIADAGLAKTVNGLLFPMGLAMVILSGSELFTGNCLMTMGVLDKRIRLTGMLRNLVVVYIGNFVGALIVSFCVAKFGQLNIGAGALAAVTMKITAAKCSIPWANAFVQGILCNILVCFAVLFSLSAKDVTGRILGAFIPVCFFVIMGYNHSIADMFYGTVGIFAADNPTYLQLAQSASVDMTHIGWGCYFLNNMIPVTLGNIVGGVLVSASMWFCHFKKSK